MTELPEDLSQALDETSARSGWDAYSEELKQDALDWIETAKTTTARSKRIDDVARHAGKGLPPSALQ
ncbi:hypothetical protein C1J03_01585 [Sulfitobacter sp. SK012]|uniref:YdeI/OmpD-associated family protein n=1 Tax=Sulfitobacter sp. SK012 TaxID=1389005 RepID=UPI000E0C1E45|nr:YdeI/OmpD-associated family protein [Sulfitobacter sp. SK012]AXI44838.1 hypothetical protein C1J03_01585 [Sulfitobacter sp. SK012]